MPTPAATGPDRRSPTPAAARKREAIHTLKEGLAGDRIVLCYQPVVDARSARIEAVEALLRWRGGADAPPLADLVFSAERSPVIFKLENWVLERSFETVAAWTRAGMDGVRLQVNLSAREFPRADLVRRLRRRLRAAGASPHAVGVEITETSAMSHFDEVAEQMEELTAMGIELWLDDFGTGHSTLEWLGRLPARGIKIPGLFTTRLEHDARCRTIVSRVIELAHDLGLRVIAEGVETEAQRDLLAGSGCDLFQGFLFHAPMSPDEVARAAAVSRS